MVGTAVGNPMPSSLHDFTEGKKDKQAASGRAKTKNINQLPKKKNDDSLSGKKKLKSVISRSGVKKRLQVAIYDSEFMSCRQ